MSEETPAGAPAAEGNQQTENNNRGGDGANQGGNSGAGTGARNQHKPTRRNKPKIEEKKFRGETTEMNDHVFQTHAERTNKSQFIDTIEKLRVYCSKAYKNDIEALTPLFTKLETPKVKQPEDPIMTKTADEDGNVTEKMSKFQEMRYNEVVKQWIRDDRSLAATIRSLYNIVWGQCSKQVKIKVKMSKKFKEIEEEGDVTAL